MLQLVLELDILEENIMPIIGEWVETHIVRHMVQAMTTVK
jgi:hypothetical protein